ncbi:hypothetical protein BpHYR1_047667 [Brachionus plicatilis]|uniref:Uncharacterized protein n=1 Tax=Brachionus plicatilis TaxID=10195 RepID=A0A3M7S194_BRAPC|nr:hypothetical protein BpHYR1_047667 [Brachionus plicatilis]
MFPFCQMWQAIKNLCEYFYSSLKICSNFIIRSHILKKSINKNNCFTYRKSHHFFEKNMLSFNSAEF